jgi:NADH-quinone oxidoreductase subunit G
MACPGGCVGGGGQPVPENMETTKKRAKGLYDNDRMLQLHKSQDNPYVSDIYEKLLGIPNSHVAHELLHTTYKPRQRTEGEDILIFSGKSDSRTDITFCFGTGCFVKGAQELLKDTVDFMKDAGITDSFEIKATFCHENCSKGPVVDFDGEMIEKCTLEKLKTRMVPVEVGKR